MFAQCLNCGSNAGLEAIPKTSNHSLNRALRPKTGRPYMICNVCAWVRPDLPPPRRDPRPVHPKNMITAVGRTTALGVLTLPRGYFKIRSRSAEARGRCPPRAPPA